MPKLYSSKLNAWFTPATFRDFCWLLFGDFVTQRLWFWFLDFGRFFSVISDFGRHRTGLRKVYPLTLDAAVSALSVSERGSRDNWDVKASRGSARLRPSSQYNRWLVDTSSCRRTGVLCVFTRITLCILPVRQSVHRLMKVRISATQQLQLLSRDARIENRGHTKAVLRLPTYGIRPMFFTDRPTYLSSTLT